MSTRRVSSLVVGLLLLALGSWFFWPRAGGEGAEKNATPAEVQSPAEGLPPVKTPQGPKKRSSPLPKREKGETLEARLAFRVLSQDAKALPGKIYWVYSAAPPKTSRLMAPEFGFDLSPGVEHRSHQGSGSLEVPPGRWTWLRVTGVQDRRVLARYALVPPFSGTKTLELRLSPTKRRIHVFLLQKDLVSPAGGEELRLFRREGAKTKLVQKKRTDGNGYVVFEEDRPGAFLVLAPGATLRDKAPYVGAVILTPKVNLHNIAMTLLVPEPRVRVDFAIQVGLPPNQGLPPKLFLKRLDGMLGALYPMPGILGKGMNRFSLEVPRGSYELSALPLGRIRIPRQNRILQVEQEGQKVELRLFAEGKKIPVTLQGLGYRDFPVSIYPRVEKPLQDDELKLMFCGPYRWRIPKNQAAFPKGVFDLLAFGRFGTWISQRKHSSSEARMLVRLKPATLLDFTWRGVMPRGSAMMRVRDERGVFYRILSKRLVPEGGGMFRALVGRLVVARGRVQLDLMEGDRILWTKAFKARKARMNLVAGVKGS
ncbi:MAG TPA: hypothetical protein ENK02_15380 [Planctomycetes bacterium]|nr:hypothetical protein [Planctomycetota bacterium]